MTITVGGQVPVDRTWSDDERCRLRARVIVRDGHLCHYCSRPLDTRRSLGTLDHLWPRSRGRVDALWNLVLACGACNSSRGDALDWCLCRRCSRARWIAPLVVLLNSPVTRR